jgi:hypothetical protein
MHAEINNEKKIIWLHELLKLHSLQRDWTALKIESTVYYEMPLTNYQSTLHHIPQKLFCVYCSGVKGEVIDTRHET